MTGRASYLARCAVFLVAWVGALVAIGLADLADWVTQRGRSLWKVRFAHRRVTGPIRTYPTSDRGE